MSQTKTTVPFFDAIIEECKSPLLRWYLTQDSGSIPERTSALTSFATSAGEEKGRFALYFSKSLKACDETIVKIFGLIKWPLFVFVLGAGLLGWATTPWGWFFAGSLMTVAFAVAVTMMIEIAKNLPWTHVAAIRSGRIDVHRYDRIKANILKPMERAREYEDTVRLENMTFGSPVVFGGDLTTSPDTFLSVLNNEIGSGNSTSELQPATSDASAS